MSLLRSAWRWVWRWLGGVSRFLWWLMPPDDGDVLTYQDPQVDGLSQAFKPISLPLFKGVVTLTDAQIKALPTTPVELVPMPGAGESVVPLMILATLHTEGHGYTNLNPAGCFLFTGPATTTAQYDESSSGALAASTDGDVLTFLPYAPVAGGFVAAAALGAVIDQPLNLLADNSAAGNWTGGDASNSMVITTIYTVLTT